MKQRIVPIVELLRAMDKSPAERMLAYQIEDAQLPAPEVEYRFCEPRLWRFDFCWPAYWLAVEVEGGFVRTLRGEWHTTYGHASANRFIADVEKYNEAAMMGFRLLRFPSALVEDGTAIKLIRRFFEEFEAMQESSARPKLHHKDMLNVEREPLTARAYSRPVPWTAKDDHNGSCRVCGEGAAPEVLRGRT